MIRPALLLPLVFAVTTRGAVADDMASRDPVVRLAQAAEPDIPQVGLGEMPIASEDIAAALMLAVQRCWVVDLGSKAAGVVVTLKVELDIDGRVVPGSVGVVRTHGGEGDVVQQAFAAARRAVLRCQMPDGYALPPERHALWKHIEMTFDPRAIGQR